MREKIGPLVMSLGNSRAFMALKVNSSNLPAFLSKLEGKWNKLATNQPFDPVFMDDAFNAVYTQEVRIGKIVNVLTFLAIFIACLGLFGLASFTAEQRTKEIGIRKILGAPVTTLFMLLTSDFTKWIIIANLIALPIAYYSMSSWLENFEYQAGVGISSLVLAGISGLLVALITVSYQAFRAASLNPVDSLRYE